MERAVVLGLKTSMTKEEEQKIVRKLVLDSYQDVLEGKGRDAREFFEEMERRYQFADV